MHTWHVDIIALQKRLNITFYDPELLLQAITHPTGAKTQSTGEHNERLEFLGDAILDGIIAEYLYRNNIPASNNKQRDYVRSNTLIRVANKLMLSRYLIASHKFYQDHRWRQACGDAVEAIIGAIFLDQEIKVTAAFVYRFFIDQNPPRNYRTTRIYSESTHPQKTTALENQLGFRFFSSDLLVRSLTHSSYQDPSVSHCLPQNNVELTRLGNALLKQALSEYAFRNYDTPEGALTTVVASGLVRTTKLAIANEMDLINLVLVGASAYQCPKAWQRIGSDIVAALAAAIYLDQGYRAFEQFLFRYFIPRLSKPTRNLPNDWKSRLQDHMQATLHTQPTYRVINKEGPDDNPTFTIAVYSQCIRLAQGTGPGKKATEQEAARLALSRLA